MLSSRAKTSTQWTRQAEKIRATATTSNTRSGFTGEQLQERLGLMKDSDTVEPT
jgi:hypothetical protein